MTKNNIIYSVDTLISEKQIKTRITELGKEVNQFYKNTNKLLVVGLLRGSFIFIADLVRELKIPVEVDFMTVSSYGNSMHSSNNVRILTDLNTDIKNSDVLLVEDIIDTGITLEKIISLLKKENVADIKIATLLFKPEAYTKDIPIDFIGKSITNDFVVGYGLDYDELGRNLQHIYKLKE